jgi:4,4'-diaponeurosporenoate glycosyltransferase
VLSVLPLGYGAFALSRLRPPRSPGRGPRPAVSIVVPALNEADSLPGLLASLARQQPPPEEVVVVDDGSTDATAAVARAFGATVVVGGAGKASSLDLGARTTTSPVVVFVDADVVFERPEALRALVEELSAIPGGLVSLEPFHAPAPGVEQCSAMANLVSILSCAPSADHRPESRARAVAFGPVMAIRRSDYEAVGGHRALLGAGDAEPILDDVGLARRFADDGRPVRWLIGADLVSFRMYADGAGALVEGWTKNLASGATSAPLLGSLGATAWVVAALASSLGALGPGGRWLLPVAVAYSLQARAGLGRLGRFARWTWALLPVSLGALSVLGVVSAWKTWVRGAVTWRGRVVAVRRAGR